MKREDEEFCKSRFSEFLANVLKTKGIEWEDGPRNEPPDYYLTINNTRFAVEVTQFQVTRDTILGTGRVLEKTYEAWCRQLVEEIEGIVISEGVLKGTYVISFDAPIIQGSNELNAIRVFLKTQILVRIRQAQGHESDGFRQPIWYGNHFLCDVTKTINDVPLVVAEFSDGGWIESSEFIKRLHTIVQDALERKASNNQFGNIKEPKILLFLDTFHLALPQQYREYFQTVSDAMSFHSVFLVQEHQVVLLTTNDETWSRL